jgi:hypothetical protein
MAMKWSDVAANPAFQALSFDEQEEARNQYFNEVVAPQVSKDEIDAVRGEFLADTQTTLAPPPDTGDETARLAARYKAPEKPGLIARISSALPKPADPLGIASGKPMGAPRAQEPAKAPKEPTPYRDRREALDDAVNLLEEGADQKAVTEAFAKGGIKFDEIVAHGKKRGSEYFAQQPGMEVADSEVARLANRYPAPVTGEIKSTRPETPLPGADVLLAGAKGVVGGFKMLMNAGGAGGKPSSTAEKALETADSYLEGLRSAAAVKDDERIGQIMDDAKNGTWTDQVVAAAKAAGVAPASLVAQGLGTSVPVILASLLPGVRESTVARLTAQIGLGAAQGAGATKEAIYTAVKEDMLRAGVSKVEAEERAVAAQSYLGQNKDQIAIGMALGALASSTGVEKVIPIGQVSKVLAKSGVSRAVAAAEQNVIGRGLIGGVTEAVPEFAQGSAEQVAQNVALQREGRDVPTFQGAVGKGALEAIAGFGAGGVTNAAFGRPQTDAEQFARELDVSIANTDFTSADPIARARMDVNSYDPTLISPAQTARGVADVGPSAPISFTPVGSPTQQAGLVDIVVPTAPETTDVSTLGATGGQPDLRGPAGGDQLGGGLGVSGPDAAGTGQLSGGDAGLPAANAGADVPAGSAAGQSASGIALPRVTARATDQDLLARTEASIAAPENNNAVVQPAEQWFGRKGDGYTTQGDAQQALPGRQRMFPNLGWKVESMANGKFRLAGYSNAQETTLGTQTPQAIQGQTQGQQAPAISGAASQGLAGGLQPGDAAQTSVPAVAGAAAPGVADNARQLASAQPELGEPLAAGASEGERAAVVGGPLFASKVKSAPISIIKLAQDYTTRQTGVEFVPVSSNNLSEQQRAASLMATLNGQTVTFIEQTAGDQNAMPNGLAIGGKHVMIDVKSEDAPLAVAMHEVVHNMPDNIRKPLEAALRNLFKSGMEGDFKREFNYEDADLDKEIPAMITQAVTKRKDFWNELRQEMGNKDFSAMAELIITRLDNWVRGVRSEYGDGFINKYVTDVEQARSLISKAYAQSMRDQGLQPNEAAAGDVMASQRTRADGERAYAGAPNSLMGFKKSGPQTAYEDSKYKKEITVRVTFDNGTSMVDGMKGLNTPHAMERARRNWDGAEIELLAEEPYSDELAARFEVQSFEPDADVAPPEQLDADGIQFSLRKVEEINDAPEITMQDLVGETVFPILADLTAAGYVYMGKELRGGPYYTLLPSNSKAGLIWANDGKGVASIKNKKAARGVIGLIVAMKQDSHATNNTVANIIFRAVEDEIQKGSVAEADIPKLDEIVRGLAARTVTKNRKVDGKKVKETKQVFPKFADFPGFSDREASEKFLRSMPFEARGLFFQEMTKPTVEDLGLGVVRKVINDTVEPDLRGLNMGDVVMAIRFDPNADTIELGEKTGTPEHDSYRYGVKGTVIGKFKRPISFENVFVELMKQRRAAGKDRAAGNYRSLTLKKPEQKITQEIADSVSQEAYKTFKSPAEAKAAVASAAGDWNLIERPTGAGVKEFLRTSRIYGEGKVPSFVEAKKLIKDGDLKIFRLGETENWFAIEKRGQKSVMTSIMVAQPGVRRETLFADMVYQAKANNATHIEINGTQAPILDQEPMRPVAPIVAELSEMKDADLINLGIDPKEINRLNGLIEEDGAEQFSPTSLVMYSNRAQSPADRIKWRKVSDVKTEIGLDALPRHIIPFATFMRTMADKAANGGLTSRDLIKAYTIARSSMNRTAVTTSRIKDAGLVLPENYVEDKIRPEGAFGYWLLSPVGQRYLNAAEVAIVDQDAVADAVKVMAPFGTQNALGKDLERAAGGDLHTRLPAMAAAIAKAATGKNAVKDWQDATDNLFGVREAKKGFLGSLLGFGQLPTFDARQINVNVKPDSKEDTLRALSSVKARDVVAKLARRMDALSLTMDPEYAPFYQHLAHHAVWDAVGGTETTHSDVIESMIMASNRAKPAFYSQLERVIANVPAKLATQPATQWALWLDSNGPKAGVKKDEVEWSGIKDYLALRGKDKVTSAELQAYLKDGGVKVEESMIGMPLDEDALTEQVTSELFTVDYDDLSRSEQREVDAVVEERMDARTTKYDKYVLPGGENYRELLLKLPVFSKEKQLQSAEADMARAIERNDLGMQRAYGPALDKLRAQKAKSMQTYESSHWSDKNVVAHIRLNDRTDADGKRVLFVEEVQSDWGQDGLKKGFKPTPAARAKQDARIAELSDQIQAIRDAGVQYPAEGTAISEVDPKFIELQKLMEERVTLQSMERSTGSLPSAAPFVNKTEGWLNLALKRIAMLAVEEGYDKVAFANGQQSADRYDLSKQISSISYEVGSKPENEGLLQAWDLNRNMVMSEMVTTDRIEDYVGKEVAQRLLNTEKVRGKHLLDGENIKVGGKGMIKFYDEIVPQAITKLLPKIGGEKLGSVGVPLPVGNGEKTPMGAVQWVINVNGREYNGYSDEGVARLELAELLEDGKNAELIDARNPETSQQPGFDVTDKMRETVGAGLPMFSKRAAAPEADDAESDIEEVSQSNRRQKLSTIGQNFTLPGTGGIDAARIKLQDDALRMKRVIEAVKAKGGTVGEAQNFYDANTLMPGRVQATMDDFRDNVMRPLIDKAVSFGIDLDELALYAYAKHAEERNAYIASINKRMPDGGSGMTDAHAKSILQLAKASGDEAKFEELHRDLMAITSTTRQVMLAEGLISQDEFNALDGSYENYIPLRGLENVDENTGAVRPGVGRGINVRGGETIKALGRKSQASDLIENVIRDYQRVIMRVEKNDVGKVLLDFVLSNPDPDLWGVDVERSKPALNKATGLVQYTKNVEKGEDTIGVKVGGEQVYIKLADPELARAIRQAWKDETSGLERATLAMTGWWNNWMRNVLTRYNPAFAAINIPRDALWSGTSAALAELGPKGLAKYLANYGKALMASTRQEAGVSGTANKVIGNQQMDQVFQEFRNAGAITGGFYMRSLDDINKDLRNEMLLAGAKAKNTFEAIKSLPPYKLATLTARMLEFMGSASENATRFALYQAAREVGKTPAQAALLAKNGTTNFNRKGEWGGALNNLYLFFNAAVQGNAQLVKVLKSPAVQASMAGVAGVGVMLAMYGASAGGEDDDGEAYWDKVPSYVKERNLVFMLPPGDALADGIQRAGKRGRYFTIPVQYGFNIFPNAGYMMADVFRNAQDPQRGVTPTKAALHMTSTVFGSINPFGGALDFGDGVQVLLAAMPTLLDLPVQLINERGTFGSPSAPEKSSFDVRPDSSRMFTSQMNTVSEKIAKALNELGGGNEAKAGKILGIETSVTPGTIQTLISATTGGLGSFVEQVGSSVIAMTGDDKDLKAAKIPFVNKFYGEVDESANIRGAGDRMREIKKLSDEVKAQQKIGLDPELNSEEERLMGLASMQESYQKFQTQLRKAEIAIIKDDKMTEAEKKLQRRQIQVERDRLATEVNREYLKSLK